MPRKEKQLTQSDAEMNSPSDAPDESSPEKADEAKLIDKEAIFANVQ